MGIDVGVLFLYAAGRSASPILLSGPCPPRFRVIVCFSEELIVLLFFVYLYTFRDRLVWLQSFLDEIKDVPGVNCLVSHEIKAIDFRLLNNLAVFTHPDW